MTLTFCPMCKQRATQEERIRVLETLVEDTLADSARFCLERDALKARVEELEAARKRLGKVARAADALRRNCSVLVNPQSKLDALFSALDALASIHDAADPIEAKLKAAEETHTHKALTACGMDSTRDGEGELTQLARSFEKCKCTPLKVSGTPPGDFRCDHCGALWGTTA